MKICLLKMMLFCLSAPVFAQDDFKKNSLYMEAGGNGIHGSVNYERQFFSQPGLGARLGLGLYLQEKPRLTVPVGVNYLVRLRNERSFIDVGMGATWTGTEAFYILKSNNRADRSYVYFIPSAGYRRQTMNNLLWRVSFTPAITRFGPFPWLGVSLGKVF